MLDFSLFSLPINTRSQHTSINFKPSKKTESFKHYKNNDTIFDGNSIQDFKKNVRQYTTLDKEIRDLEKKLEPYLHKVKK